MADPASQATANDALYPRHPYRWVACSVAEFGHVGEQRHLARKGALTTYCGHSASYPDIWRGNTRKPKCTPCAEVEGRIIPSGSEGATSA